MSGTRTGGRSWRQTFGLAALLFVLVGGLSTVPVMREFQARLTDTYFRVAPRPEQHSKVVVVLIDDASLQQFGRWPWSRLLLEKMTNNLANAGARVIGLDILLSEPQSPEADKALAEAMQAAGHVVLVGKIGSFAEGPRWVEPLPQLAQASAAVGHTQAVLDLDSVCRRFPIRELTIDGSRWAFAIEVARQMDPQEAAAFVAAYGLHFADTSPVLTAKPLLVPIAFRRDGFATLSAAAVLQGRDLSAVRGRPVLVGFGPAELGDRITTPLTTQFPTPGVEVHAQILDGILAGRTLHEIPLAWSAVLLLITCGLVVAVFRRWRGRAAGVWVAVLVTVTYGAALAVFLWGSRILPVGQLMLAVILGPVLVFSAEFVVLEHNVTEQLRELRRWLASHGQDSGRKAADLTWKLELLRKLQTELGSLYELHQTLLATTQDLVAIFDENGSLLLRNQAFASAFLANDSGACTLQQIRAKLTPNEDVLLLANRPKVEYEAYLGDKLYFVRIVPLPATTISPGGGTVVTLTSLEARVERDRARAEVLGFVTHELRTPLVSIQGFADLMMQHPASPSCARAPETIFRESRRLLALINSYLDVLRLDAGARPIRSDQVELTEVIRQTFDILQPLATAAQMRLRLEQGELREITGDANLISGAVLNLVSNAIKYGRPGTDVTVRCYYENGQAVVRVHNASDPIPAQEIPHLFDAYYRGPNAEGEKPGFGIGLAFVKRIAEKHGGSVRVESERDGVSFEIRLPAAAAAVSLRGSA